MSKSNVISVFYGKSVHYNIATSLASDWLGFRHSTLNPPPVLQGSVVTAVYVMCIVFIAAGGVLFLKVQWHFGRGQSLFSCDSRSICLGRVDVFVRVNTGATPLSGTNQWQVQRSTLYQLSSRDYNSYSKTAGKHIWKFLQQRNFGRQFKLKL